MDKALIPKISYATARQTHGRSEEWLNYARRIARNDYVKGFLASKGPTCPCCGLKLNSNAVVHHIDYDHRCAFRITIRVEASTPKRPSRTHEVPDCESCRADDERRFHSCMSRLVLVHRLCNLRIAQAYHDGPP